jgi:hypothetical protein
MNIKCLSSHCNKIFGEDALNLFLNNEIRLKYQRFKASYEKLNNKENKFIPCPSPNCEEFIKTLKNNQRRITQCDKKHIFCIECRNLGYHSNRQCVRLNLIKRKK